MAENKILDLEITRYKQIVMINVLHQDEKLYSENNSIKTIYSNSYMRLLTGNNNVLYSDMLCINKKLLDEDDKIIVSHFPNSSAAINVCREIQNALDKVNEHAEEYLKE